MITIHIEITERREPVQHVAVKHRGSDDGHPSRDEIHMGNLMRQAINDTLEKEAKNSGKWHHAEIIKLDLTRGDKP